MTHHSERDVVALIAETRAWTREDAQVAPRNLRQHARTVADVLEAVLADSLTGQAMHARWQERAENLEAAIRAALSVE